MITVNKLFEYPSQNCDRNASCSKRRPCGVSVKSDDNYGPLRLDLPERLSGGDDEFVGVESPGTAFGALSVE